MNTTEDVTAIYNKYGYFIYRQASKILHDDEAALDAVQDILEKIMRNLSGFRNQSTLYTWIYRITTNHCLNVIKHRKFETMTEGLSREVMETDPSPEQIAQTRELIGKLLLKFDQTTREIVYYYYIDSLTHEEIVEVLQISRKTVHNKLTRFRERSKKILAKISG